MTEDTMPFDQLGREIHARVSHANKAYEKGENLAISAGKMLLTAKRRCDAGEYRNGEPFRHFLLRECKVGPSRAYELMKIANGQTTYKAVRDAANARKSAHRAANKEGASVRSRNGHAQAPDSQGEKAGNLRNPQPLVPIKNKGGRPPKGSLFDEAIRELTKVARTKTYEQVLAIVNYAKGL